MAWHAPHSIDIGQRVGGGDPTKHPRVVDDWRNHIAGQHQPPTTADRAHDCSIVTQVVADENIGRLSIAPRCDGWEPPFEHLN